MLLRTCSVVTGWESLPLGRYCRISPGGCSRWVRAP